MKVPFFTRKPRLPKETGRVLDFTKRRRMWGHNIEFFQPGTALGWGDYPQVGDVILHEFRSSETGGEYVARLLVTSCKGMWGVSDGWDITYANLGPAARPEETTNDR